MFLRKVKLLNFKNHTNVDFFFKKRINALVGKNGVGKTNILDFIYFLGLTKSYFGLTDQQLIKKGKDFFRLEAFCENNENTYEIIIKLAEGKKKEWTVNGVQYPKVSDHLGMIPVIILSPEDSSLIHGNSEARRKLIDSTLCQVDNQYLQSLIQYNKFLEQRNALLKNTPPSQKINVELLHFYNHQLSTFGSYIYSKRKALMDQLAEYFNQIYDSLSRGGEKVAWIYESQLRSNTWENLFRQSFEKDLILQRTNVGVHKDDFEFIIEQEKIKKFGSQGQQKSFLLAIKLSLYKYIKESKGVKPILLLDDLFDKLDATRVAQLIAIISNDDFGQVFITDTDKNRILNSFEGKDELLDCFTINKNGD